MERMSVLSEHQERVMKRVLAEESAHREHVVVYLSGAHAYGFPSPDSDLDLKAIHIAKTDDLLGFEPPAPTFDRAEVIEGVEIDYTSNELAHALSGMLAGNGNFIERVLGRLTIESSSMLLDLRLRAKSFLSRRVHKHYRGFAQNQLRFAETEPSAKKLLYVLRTAMTGIHLLETGELETDLTRLMPEAMPLVQRKRTGERVAIDRSLLDEWRPRIDALFVRLDRARDTSPLPEEPTGVSELRDFLVAVRRQR